MYRYRKARGIEKEATWTSCLKVTAKFVTRFRRYKFYSHHVLLRICIEHRVRKKKHGKYTGCHTRVERPLGRYICQQCRKSESTKEGKNK